MSKQWKYDSECIRMIEKSGRARSSYESMNGMTFLELVSASKAADLQQLLIMP